jgi:hypothetical protein
LHWLGHPQLFHHLLMQTGCWLTRIWHLLESSKVEITTSDCLTESQSRFVTIAEEHRVNNWMWIDSDNIFHESAADKWPKQSSVFDKLREILNLWYGRRQEKRQSRNCASIGKNAALKSMKTTNTWNRLKCSHVINIPKMQSLLQ